MGVRGSPCWRVLNSGAGRPGGIRLPWANKPVGDRQSNPSPSQGLGMDREFLVEKLGEI